MQSLFPYIRPMKFLRNISFPIAIIYWIVISLRNLLFDWGILKSKTYSIPTIGVGNLMVGGTGKSPTIEYLIRLLKDEFKIATLSRGYGRKSKGFIEASALSSSEEIGDEPTQFKQKFNEVTVAVSENRGKGLLKLQDNYDAVLLDDAFQHRSVNLGLSILLFDYNKVFEKDWMLPFGNLREPISGMDRAQIILITKTPKIFSPMERRRVESKLNIKSNQHIFYSYLKYVELKPLHESHPIKTFNDLDKRTQVLVLTGIADPTLFLNYIDTMKVKNIVHVKYADHYMYKKADIEKLKKSFGAIDADKKIIITTEKDAMRLLHPKFENLIIDLPIYYVPIESEIQEKDKEEFDNLILNYVRTSKKHR